MTGLCNTFTPQVKGNFCGIKSDVPQPQLYSCNFPGVLQLPSGMWYNFSYSHDTTSTGIYVVMTSENQYKQAAL